MATTHYVAVDLVTVYTKRCRHGKKDVRDCSPAPCATGKVAWQPLRILGYGDEIEEISRSGGEAVVRLKVYARQPDHSVKPEMGVTGAIRSCAGYPLSRILQPAAQNPVLRVSVVDVQQGDGVLIEARDPASGRDIVMIVDGGDNQLFARYLAGRFPGTSETSPQPVDCIVVTHFDSDHYKGLIKIKDSERYKPEKGSPVSDAPWKRIWIDPARFYHSGLVPRAGKSVPPFGTQAVGPDGTEYCTDLVGDLAASPPANVSPGVGGLCKALQEYRARRGAPGLECKRLAKGDSGPFGFAKAAGLDVDVLWPAPTAVGGVAALKLYGEPAAPAGKHVALATGGWKWSSKPNDSHSVNGQSVVLRLRYGGFSMLLTGDLNAEPEDELVRGGASLESVVLKAPHHGSAEFCLAFVEAVKPVVTLVSSGDESVGKDYIHPSATAMAAYGMASRRSAPGKPPIQPIVLVTELAAFYNQEGWSVRLPKNPGDTPTTFYGFSRKAFGLIKLRTDGKRLLVWTDAADPSKSEAYAFDLTNEGSAAEVEWAK